MPTLTSLVEYQPSQDPLWDGIDIWQLLAGDVERLPKRPIYWNFRGRDYAVRLENWKLIDDSRNGEIELFNLGNDPYESKNLATDQPNIVKDLRAIIQEEQEKDNVSKRSDID